MKSLKETLTDLRAGRTTAAELTGVALTRAEDSAKHLGAYREVDADSAKGFAEAADKAFLQGVDLGPLQGVPVSVKDLFGVTGTSTYAGSSRPLPDKWCREGPVVTTLRRQLTVLAGKTHTVEFAFGGLGVNTTWGTPRNPWDPEHHRVPGGSSCGAGISLQEGSAMVALGTDTAGSVRIPASMTGVVGFKTSHGRWSIEGVVPLSPTLDTVGLLARSVEDASVAFAAIDPTFPQRGDFVDPIEPVPLSTVVCGIGEPSLWEDCEPGILESVKTALNELENAGMTIRDEALPEARDAIELLHLGNVVASELDEFLDAELPEWRSQLDPVVSTRIKDGVDIPAREYLARLRRLQTLSAAMEARFEHCDVVAAPTVPISPPILEEVNTVAQYRPRNLGALRNTCSANTLDLCAISIPTGLDRLGMPVGIQLMAPKGADEWLLGVGLAVERVLGDSLRRLGRPPMVKAS